MKECPYCVADRMADRLQKRKYFHPGWQTKRSRNAWPIIRMRRCFDFMIIMVKAKDTPDWAVYTQGLRPLAIASDKFFGTKKAAEDFFRSQVEALG